MNSFLSNSKINEIPDSNLEKDLESNTLTADKKTLIVQELSRRRLTELMNSINSLNTTIKSASESSAWFTRVLLVVATLQLVIAIMQVVFSLFGPVEYWVAVGLEVFFFIIIFFVIKHLVTSLNIKSNPKKVGQDK